MFQFQSVKEVLAKANELKSGDILAGVAASFRSWNGLPGKRGSEQNVSVRTAGNPVVPYEEDEVTRIIQDSVDETVYSRIRNWTVGN